MAALRFEVHVDKENATPAHVVSKGGALTTNSFKGDRGKLQNTVHRKALLNVINEQANVPASKSHEGKHFGLDKDRNNLKPLHKVSEGAENVPSSTDYKKHGCSIVRPSLQKLQSIKGGDLHTSKRKLTETQKKQNRTNPEPDLQITEDDDSIFPKSERLTSYVSKLLTWRPPCLFGALPDSESEDSDPEELLEDNILLDMPLSLPAVSGLTDEDLDDLMMDCPPPMPACNDELLGDSCQDIDLELALNQTMNTSLTFGSLQVMHDSVNTSHTSDGSSLTDLNQSAS